MLTNASSHVCCAWLARCRECSTKPCCSRAWNIVPIVWNVGRGAPSGSQLSVMSSYIHISKQ